MLCSCSVCACAYFVRNVCATFAHVLVLHVYVHEYTCVWCLVWMDTYTVLKVSEHLWELLLTLGFGHTVLKVSQYQLVH